MEESKRRELSFSTLDECVSDAQMLAEKGYDSVGDWDLVQVLGHCGNWMTYPIDGFPKPNFFMRGMMWAMRVTVAKSMIKKVLESGSMPAGNPTVKESVPSPNATGDKQAVEKFAETVQRFKDHSGPFLPSPLFGQMDEASLMKLNLIHTQHHLSFLVPKE